MSISAPYAKLSQYCGNPFGFMRFTPPLSAPLHNPYERKNDPPIAYTFSYNALVGKGKPADSINNTPYASIANAY